MNRFESNLLEVINQKDKIRDKKILIACSGGADSTALLFLLAAVKKSLNLTLDCIYIDHDLRSREEIELEIKTINLHTENLNIPFYVERTRRKIESPVEFHAREERLMILGIMVGQNNYDYVATGHHLYDYFETLLIQLNRADSDKALKGFNRISPYRWRPLLHLRKEELETYLRNKGISWCIDESNFQDFTIRNKIRKVMPLLRDIVPHFESNFLEAMNRNLK